MYNSKQASTKTASLFDDNVHSDIFYSWLQQDWLSKFRPDTVIVMGNATFHKRKDLLDAIVHSGAIVEFLPPYNPDLNPIEQKTQVKEIRKVQCCKDIDYLFVKYFEYANS